MKLNRETTQIMNTGNRITKLLCLLLLTLLSSASGAAENLHIGHCLAGCPEGAAADNTVIIRSIYALSFNNQNLAADWAAYEISAATVGIASSLSRQVLPDPYLPQAMTESEFARLGSVAGSGRDGEGSQGSQGNQESPAGQPGETREASRFDRSYLVPLVNFSATPFWQETNYLGNMVLRTRNLNQGAWYGLEWAIRNLANREDSLFVLSGPIYELDDISPEWVSRLPQSKQRIAAGFFQIVATAGGAVSAFVFSQESPVHRHHCEQRTTLSELEQLTGLNFFPLRPQWPEGSLDQGLGCQATH